MEIKDNLDKRVFQRLPCNFSVNVKELYGHTSDKAKSFDLSATGLGVIAKRSLPLNSEVELLIRFARKRVPLRSKAKVRWFRQEASGKWRLGLEFIPLNIIKLTPLFANRQS